MDSKTMPAIALVLALLALALALQATHGETVRVRATTTTSLYATGLLEHLAREFQSTHRDVTIQYIPVGSGEALKRAERGDACLVLVHAPSLEKRYIDEGVIGYHRIFAYNYFVIVGPGSDPAGVKGSKSIVEVMHRIYNAGEAGRIVFVSRGDRSGTHVRELQLWREAGLDPTGKPWYIETGQGMGETLVIAGNKEAYTLSDIGTYLKFKAEGRIPGLEILYSGDPSLINIYSAYLVTGCSGRERDAAKAFIDFLVSSRGQRLIASYGVEEYGQPLFHPVAGRLSQIEAVWRGMAEGG
ncbi:MAG: substrate-binding domain-containing protein [Desulfurococcales archaeon]|nr:substrate-binding domain-containing protein [Desulfurococcales archaeon]